MNMYYLVIFLFIPFVNTNEMFVEDLETVFKEKDCIEASQMSMRSFENTNIMFEKESINNPLKQIPLLINITELTKSATESDKSVMSKINELAQYNKFEYTYELISEEGPPHKRIFTVLLKLSDEKYEGKGSSLKEAQRAAAALALINTEFEQPPIKLAEEQVVLTPTVILNNIATKLGIGVLYTLINEKDEKEITNYSPTVVSSTKKTYFQKLNDSIYHSDKDSLRVPTEEAQISGPFTVRVKVGESIFVGFGHTIQSARHDAATKAIKNMEKEILLRDNFCSNDQTVELCKEKKESLKSPISRIYEAGQKHNLPVEFDIISESGKSHNKLFITRCKLGEYETEGEGKSKKESKRDAAEKMLQNMAKLPEIIDGKEIIADLSPKKKNKNKKKKNKIIKPNINTIANNINTMLDSFWGTDNSETKPDLGQSKKFSPKDKLLNIGNSLKIEIQFTDLSQYQDKFHSLVTLGVQPMYLCLGKGLNWEESQQNAALHSLKFLRKAGLLKNKFQSGYSDKDSELFDDYEIDADNIVYTSPDESTKK